MTRNSVRYPATLSTFYQHSAWLEKLYTIKLSSICAQKQNAGILYGCQLPLGLDEMESMCYNLLLHNRICLVLSNEEALKRSAACVGEEKTYEQPKAPFLK